MTDRLKRCHCCDGSGVVLSSHDEERPCSRCRSAEFNAWYAAVAATSRDKADAADAQASS